MSLNANRHKKSTNIYVESYNIPQKNHAMFGYVTNRVHTNATSQVLSFIMFSDVIVLSSLCCLGVVKIVSQYKKNKFFPIMKLFDAEKEKMTSEHEIQLSSAVSVGCWLPLRVMPYYLKSYFFVFTPHFFFLACYIAQIDVKNIILYGRYCAYKEIF